MNPHKDLNQMLVNYCNYVRFATIRNMQSFTGHLRISIQFSRYSRNHADLMNKIIFVAVNAALDHSQMVLLYLVQRMQ